MGRILNFINSVKNWVKKPYYYDHTTAFKIKASVGIGLLVFILLVLLSPVKVKIITINPYLFKFYFGVITTLNLFFFFFITEKAFKKFFNSETWTVGKHFFTIISLIVFSSIIRWLFLYFFFPVELQLNNISLLKMIINSFSIGFFLVLIFIYFDEKQQSEKFAIDENELQEKRNTKIRKISENKSVTLYATNKKDFITFNLNDLIYMYSESNYACIILKDKNKDFKEEILRVPLHAIEKELEPYNQIFRCHKSYIVNTDYVNNISGNARGYSLHLKNNIKQIPVSRKFTKEQLQDAV